jgi:hypothetical protein
MLKRVQENKMPIMEETRQFIAQVLSAWSLDSAGSVGLMLFLYFLASWLICFAAAFCKVREPRYYVGLLSMGFTMLVSLLLAGLCRYYLPDLAQSFSSSGLMLFSSLVGILVLGVPVIQAFWKTGYLQGFFCIFGGFVLFFMLMVGIQLMTESAETLPARLKTPLFQNHQLK